MYWRLLQLLTVKWFAYPVVRNHFLFSFLGLLQITSNMTLCGTLDYHQRYNHEVLTWLHNFVTYCFKYAFWVRQLIYFFVLQSELVLVSLMQQWQDLLKEQRYLLKEGLIMHSSKHSISCQEKSYWTRMPAIYQLPPDLWLEHFTYPLKE